MTNPTATPAFGFVCPPEFADKWSRNECTIEPEVGGASFVVLDHSLQTVVYRGKSHGDCQRFLGLPYDQSDDPVGAWLFDLAEESGQMVMCPDCGEWYWREDGHPEGTLCPKYGINAPKKPVKDEPGMVECKQHPGTFYWYEDFCKLCEAEHPE